MDTDIEKLLQEWILPDLLPILSWEILYPKGLVARNIQYLLATKQAFQEALPHPQLL